MAPQKENLYFMMDEFDNNNDTHLYHVQRYLWI